MADDARLSPGTEPSYAGRGVRIRSLVRRFGDHTVLAGVDLDIAPGEFTALLGHSGSGKSTLLRAAARLDPGVDGTVEVPEATAVVFQDARLLPWARVLDNVVLGLPGSRTTARELGRAALAEVGLAGKERAWPGTLSGGEAQRAALARALVRAPGLLLLDEPFGALDALTRIRMHALLRDLCARHRPAVLLVTHDVDEAIALADRVLVLDEGRFAADLDIAGRLGTSDRHAHPRFAATREALLGLLGVTAT
ncbi:ABC transporter ATP-binding protein [Streptomyces sp. NPDC060198]|uniref:ABC transporter ATP-binding protein n=1 Tax=Streptomyces sp. NPDC060198 TaxID=3347070 RepID=UPI00365E3CCC